MIRVPSISKNDYDSLLKKERIFLDSLTDALLCGANEGLSNNQIIKVIKMQLRAIDIIKSLEES